MVFHCFPGFFHGFPHGSHCACLLNGRCDGKEQGQAHNASAGQAAPNLQPPDGGFMGIYRALTWFKLRLLSIILVWYLPRIWWFDMVHGFNMFYSSLNLDVRGVNEFIKISLLLSKHTVSTITRFIQLQYWVYFKTSMLCRKLQQPQGTCFTEMMPRMP